MAHRQPLAPLVALFAIAFRLVACASDDGSARPDVGAAAGGMAGTSSQGGAGGGITGPPTYACGSSSECARVCIGDKLLTSSAPCTDGACAFGASVLHNCLFGCSAGYCKMAMENGNYATHACRVDTDCASSTTVEDYGFIAQGDGHCNSVGVCEWSFVNHPCECPTPYGEEENGVPHCTSLQKEGVAPKGCAPSTAGGMWGGTAGASGKGGTAGNAGGAGAQSCSLPSQCVLPEPACDGNDVVSYSTPACDGGACSFLQHTEACSGMCMGGSCVPAAGGGGGAGGSM